MIKKMFSRSWVPKIEASTIQPQPLGDWPSIFGGGWGETLHFYTFFTTYLFLNVLVPGRAMADDINGDGGWHWMMGKINGGIHMLWN